MKNFKHIEQGTIEWLQLKWAKIGGTLSKGLFVKSDTLFIDIISQRLESFEIESMFKSEAMERGTELEPFAIEFLEQYTGLKFQKTGWLQSDENELLGISPDGITEDETISCECKCLMRKNHTEALINDEIPLNYIFQCIHYFTVNPKLEKHYFIAYRPEAPKNLIKVLTRESIVNIGTAAKPINITISEAVKMSLNKANELLEQIKIKENELKCF